MRKLLIAMVAAFALLYPSGSWSAAQDFKSEKQELKSRHKAEREALKLKQQYWKQSLKDYPVPNSERTRMKHKMRREARDLRARQKDELQDLKDRQRLMKENPEQF